MGKLTDSEHLAEINEMLLSGESLSIVRAACSEKFGFEISVPALSVHRSKLQAGAGAGEQEEEEEAEGSLVFEIDFERVNEMAEATKRNAKNAAKWVKELHEINALLTLLTLQALKQHALGLARFPSEYIAKLKVVESMLP
jgi:hypothetical protein